MEHVILSFYLITQKNIVKFGYCFVIHLQLVNNDGEIFPLGTVRHNLTNRPKNSMTSLTITKDNDEIGFIECMVDTPDKLHLSGLLPPCRIIDQKSIIPPCEKVNFLHKVNPLKIG